MNRSLIRFCGYILGVIGCWAGANAAEEKFGATPSSNYETYALDSGTGIVNSGSGTVGSGSSVTGSGGTVVSSGSGGTTTDTGSDIVSGTGSTTTDTGSDIVSGTGSTNPSGGGCTSQIGGTIYTVESGGAEYIHVNGFCMNADNDFSNRYCPGGQPAVGTGEGEADLYRDCGGQHHCKVGTVCCWDKGFFESRGYEAVTYSYDTDSGAVVECRSDKGCYDSGAWEEKVPDGDIRYSFSGCAETYYYATTGGACATGATTTNLNALEACCTHCPAYYWQNGSGQTIPYAGNRCETGGFCTSSFGFTGYITSCYAYPEDYSTVFTDSAGNYIFDFTGNGSGCSYSNGSEGA